MANERYRGVARDPWTAQGVGCLWAAALMVGVVVAMNGWLMSSGQAMEPSLESFVRWSFPIGLPLGIVLGVAAWRLTIASRIEITVTDEGEGVRLRVGKLVDEAGTLGRRFEVRRGWHRVAGGRGMRLYWCDVLRDGEHLVRFSTEAGALAAMPAWPEAPPPMDRPAKHGGFVVTEIGALEKALADR
ncbi:MAG: hypothetical protein U0353_11675 [Sandaracinus sp.]